MSRKQEIIEVCVEMIDKDGFQNLSIKTIADRIGIKPPSLYKHFQGGLDEIKEAILVYGWREIDIKIAKSAVGKSREEGLKVMCYALLNMYMNSSMHFLCPKMEKCLTEGFILIGFDGFNCW